MSRAPSPACVELVKRFEGVELKAYLCPANIPTIGYGKTIGVKLGMTCTQQQADDWLMLDLHKAAAAVRAAVKVPLTQNQFDALTSFVFNVGAGNFKTSTLLKLLNARDYKGAAGQFSRWVHANGKRLRGLVIRRAAEADLFSKE